MLKIRSFTNLLENLNNDLVKCGKLPEHVAFVMDGKLETVHSQPLNRPKISLHLKVTVDIRRLAKSQEKRVTKWELKTW